MAGAGEVGRVGVGGADVDIPDGEARRARRSRGRVSSGASASGSRRPDRKEAVEEIGLRGRRQARRRVFRGCLLRRYRPQRRRRRRGFSDQRQRQNHQVGQEVQTESHPQNGT